MHRKPLTIDAGRWKEEAKIHRISFPLGSWSASAEDSLGPARSAWTRCQRSEIGAELWKMSETPIDLRPMLDSIDTDNLLGMINPIENAPVTNTQFAQARQIIGHTDQSPWTITAAFFDSHMIFRSTAAPTTASSCFS